MRSLSAPYPFMNPSVMCGILSTATQLRKATGEDLKRAKFKHIQEYICSLQPTQGCYGAAECVLWALPVAFSACYRKRVRCRPPPGRQQRHGQIYNTADWNVKLTLQKEWAVRGHCEP